MADASVDGFITAIAKSPTWVAWTGAADEAEARARIVRRVSKTPGATVRPRIIIAGPNSNRIAIGSVDTYVVSGDVALRIEGAEFADDADADAAYTVFMANLDALVADVYRDAFHKGHIILQSFDTEEPNLPTEAERGTTGDYWYANAVASFGLEG